ncbi:uncharacterized protein BDW47DRAFT_113708 [Aspergillus candidus]|uniref:Uncharacterized protein n=1 Tax=Aspergillus candidus TaxID=41067 RepID=A0A2I2EYX5_ASPCN|nr:hypothetical protein BDW47DRAFT_113708 [Aspergillus candidus]PLB33573.1 hypothetical protein BDW47DRAFT_113708 [Aspergillus candidus]
MIYLRTSLNVSSVGFASFKLSLCAALSHPPLPPSTLDNHTESLCHMPDPQGIECPRMRHIARLAP